LRSCPLWRLDGGAADAVGGDATRDRPTQPPPAASADLTAGGQPSAEHAKVGVLVINLGTPDATDPRSVRRYLRQFLSDRRVIETHPLIWQPVLNLIVLAVRPRRSGRAYDKIWNRERDESPLRTITRAQGEKLATRLAGDGVIVDWAMRYGRPSIGARIAELKREGCTRILLAPLYPQYCAATTATANDTAFRALMAMRRQPAIRTLPSYHDDPAYIDALAVSVRRSLAALSFEPEVVLASYHGLPESFVEKGDPYYDQCSETTRLLRERLGWGAERLRLTFQSRFGRGEWLKPYTAETVKALAASGVKRLAVVMPGFAADCIETLEEIAMQDAEVFRARGGTDFAAIPCLNDSDEGMTLIEALVRRELEGWIQPMSDFAFTRGQGVAMSDAPVGRIDSERA
jgi:ferrochelatase